jgi:hypothetical protein
MGRRRLVAVLGVVAVATGVLASPALAQRTTLWPGVTYEQTVQFTPDGPVVLNVLVGPRPGGATSLTPVLSNDAVPNRERLTAMQRRLTATAVTAGVNADFSAWQSGRPSGMFMRAGELALAPNANRSSAGITSDGTLEVRRVSFRGTWRAGAAVHPLTRLNDVPVTGGASLFTPAFGPATPPVPDGTAAVLFPFPLPAPGVDLPATVTEIVTAATPVPIPPGGAVLVTHAGAAAALAAEVTPGQEVVLRLDLNPEWPGLLDAVGGGPLIVRNGAPVFSAGEFFTPTQLVPRAPRSAVGQRANGQIVLVAVDGRQPGYSVGMTNFQLAQALVRLGAQTAMALDGGGSTTLAFDGSLLNRPSDPGGERAVGSALMFTYTGVFLPPPRALVSPNGDGVDEGQTLAYRLVRPATATTVTLTRPDGSVALTESAPREPGTYPVPFPPAPPGGTADITPAEGRWRLVARSIDELGNETSMTRTFVVNTTLGFVRPEKRVLRVPPKGEVVRLLWRLSRPARVGVTVEAADGTVVRVFSQRLHAAGDGSVSWNGLGRDRKRVRGGRYVVRVTAVNALGRAEQRTALLVRRIAAAS